MNNLKNHWKTTSAGLIMALGAIIHLIFSIKSHSADENTWTITVGAIIGGIGLVFAGDSSASADAKTVDAIQSQMLQVPKAIETGNTDLLNKPKPDSN